MKILIACEFSGIVRDAFLRRGHYAVSCDLLPSESDYGIHEQRDVLEILDRDWDMMIAFPPCQYLCNSGIRWLYHGGRKENGRDLARWNNMHKGATFFNALLNSQIKRVAVEIQGCIVMQKNLFVNVTRLYNLIYLAMVKLKRHGYGCET